MSGVIWGASFDNVVCLDVDGMPFESLHDGLIEVRAQRIGDRFRLGDCLIILSGLKHDFLDWTELNYHFVYDRITSWRNIHRIIRMLAREGVLEKRLMWLRLDREDFTTRMNRKTPDGFVPFPVGYVRCRYPHNAWNVPGGIKVWLEAWKIGKNISNKYGNSPLSLGFPSK